MSHPEISPLDNMRAALAAQHDVMRERYRRSLPVGELLNDRFSRAQLLGFGEKSSLYDSALVLGDVSVGENVWVGPQVLLDGSHSPLVVGNFVSINAGAQLYTHDSSHYYVSGGLSEVRVGEVRVGDCSVIGALSIVLPGVCIGSHCLIASNSVVTKSLNDYAIVAGSPAKQIGRVSIEDGRVDFRYFSKERPSAAEDTQ